MSAEKKPRATNALISLGYAATFAVIQALGASQLDGVLSWLLWANAARNVFVFVLLIHGLAQLAAKAVEADL